MVNLAALLFIQLLFIWKVSSSAGVDHQNITVIRGENVNLNCNITIPNITQITWKKDKLIFAYRTLDKMNYSNLTSDKLQIDIDNNSVSTLKLLNAQPDDAGRYSCDVAGKGSKTIEWSLQVSEEHPEVSPVWTPLYLLICVPVLLLCVVALTVCLCRKLTSSKQPVQDQFESGSGGEVTTEPQMRTTRRTENRKRSQYEERLNSIYNL